MWPIALCIALSGGIGVLFLVASVSEPRHRSDAVGLVIGLILCGAAVLACGSFIGLRERLAGQAVEAGR